LNFQHAKQDSVLQRIAKGDLSLESRKEFKDLLALFPDKADLKRAYADFLYSKNETKIAYRNYLSAADLYIREGKTIQAIVSKILAWRIVKPTHQEGREFHAALQASLTGEMPLHHFFAGMPYAAFIAVMLKLSRLKLSAEKEVVKAGRKNNALYFIVCGELKETLDSPDASGQPAPKGAFRRLSDNDIFGEVLPLAENNVCQRNVTTLTPAEVVKISKQGLMAVSRKYPLIENFLKKAYRGSSGSSQDRSWLSVRRSDRHATPVRIDLTLASASVPEHMLNLEAMSRDISIGGVCIDLGHTQKDLTAEDLAGANVGLSIHLPNVNQSLAVNGIIVWAKKVKKDTGSGIVAGIQFEPLSHETRDLLNVYCFGIDNEQTLMWSLWDSYMNG
jgi:CRP-like cAMP-binding protein